MSTRRDLDHILLILKRVADNQGLPIIKLFANMALAYEREPWDTIRDDLPKGLSDDLLVCLHTLRVIYSLPDEVRNQLPPLSKTDLHAFLKMEKEYASALPELKHVLDKYIRFPQNLKANPEAEIRNQVKKLLRDGRKVLEKLREGSGAYLEWLVEVPALPIGRKTVVIGLFSPTSGGKTTLAKRIISRWSVPAYGDFLPTGPQAHITRLPVLIDFRSEGVKPLWKLAGRKTLEGEMDEKGPSPNEAQEMIKAIQRRNDSKADWLQLSLPSKLKWPLRLIDLPGTHGFGPGDWARAAQVLTMGTDAVILPTDRRYCPPEFVDCLRGVLSTFTAERVSLALRFVDSRMVSKNTIMPGWYKFERLWENLKGKHNFGALPSCTPEKFHYRFRKMPVFTFAKSEGSPDDSMGKLLRWMIQIKPKEPRPPSYLTIEELGWKGNCRIRKEVNRVLPYIGLLRAWHAVLKED